MVGYEGLYEVSDHGRIRSVARVVERSNGRRQFVRERIRKTYNCSGRANHQVVRLAKEGKMTTKLVHRMMLESFVGPCPDGMQACHANDVADDNRLENLRWDTQSANQADSVQNSRHGWANKTHCKRGHEFTPENTRYVHATGRNPYRVCRQCDNPRQLEYYYHRKSGGS